MADIYYNYKTYKRNGAVKMVQWIYFYNKHTNERLGGYSLDGTFADELKTTIELLSFENDIKVTDIITKVESI